MIAVNMGTKHPLGKVTMHNPELFDLSPDLFTVWDDCMSIPDLMIRVKRHVSLSVRFWDDDGLERELRHVEPALAELLQHEVPRGRRCRHIALTRASHRAFPRARWTTLTAS